MTTITNPTVLDTPAVEEGTYIIIAEPFDSVPAAIIPNNDMTWTLTDAAGNVINNRADVPVSAAETMYIVLSGDDLVIETYGSRRRLLLKGTYDTTIGGTLYQNQPLKGEVQFDVVNLLAVT